MAKDHEQLEAETKSSSTDLVGLLTQHQGQLRGFILSTVGDFSHSADILQKTNLRIWENAGSFRKEAPFLPWAFTIANYEIMSFFRDRGRERVAFHAEVAESLQAHSRHLFDDWEVRQEALRGCIRRLNEEQAKILRLRYFDGSALAFIASQTGRSPQGVKSHLLRIRQKLRECIQSQLNQA